MTAASARIQRLAVIGLGLIGGSFALALRRSGLVDQVVGCARSQDSRALGLALGVIDEAFEDPVDAVAGADLIMLAVPLGLMEAMISRIAPVLGEQTVITDAGSAKGSVVMAARRHLGDAISRFVPGHPIAGSEKSGVGAASEILFERHRVILTPVPETSRHALDLVTQCWNACGANVLQMGVERHDEVLAMTSHLPHLLAFSLVDTLARDDDRLDLFRYAAGGLRDFTRIAASDPSMWRDIFFANRSAVLSALERFEAGLGQLRSAVESSDNHHLMGVSTRAKVARDQFTRILASTPYRVSPMNKKSIRFIAKGGSDLSGSIRVPGDKSISHRSIMLGSLAEGVTEITGFLEGEDALATLQAFRDMGVVIEGPVRGEVRIEGVGLHGLKQPPGPLYLGNSGTSMRLLAGILAGQTFDSELTGDASLSKRPMERVAKPLRQMGAVIQTQEGGVPPVRVLGQTELRAIDYDMPVASAQVKSSVLLAGLYAEGVTRVTEPAPTRDHTERMLVGFGYPVEVDGCRVSLEGGRKLTGCRIDVPGDISSAAFFLVAASITEGSDVVLEHVGINPTRIGVINILQSMGADIEILNRREVGGEPVADLRVRHAPLCGVRIPEDQVPLAIDEFPALFVAAACASGETLLTGAEELRVKESDRIQSMANGLTALGIGAIPSPDGIRIIGGCMKGGTVESHGDHRIAMAFSVASLRASGPIAINDCANVATSFPNFTQLSHQLGLTIEVEE